jgi:hypothetical protein
VQGCALQAANRPTLSRSPSDFPSSPPTNPCWSHPPGLDAPTASPAEVAKYTTRTMLRSVPAAVPGIHFLSGGAAG